MQDNNTIEEQGDHLYGVSRELSKEIEQLLELNDFTRVQGLIEELHAADVADLIKSLNTENRRYFIEAIKSTINADVLAELDDSSRRDVLDILNAKEIADVVSDLESDDALYVIEDLAEAQQKEVLNAIPANERAILEEVLTYPEESAGRLMQREMVCVPTFWSVQEAIQFIQNTDELPDSFYNIFVVDPRHHPIGQIALSKLLKYPSNTLVSDILDTNLHKIPVTEDQEEVAALFKHYGLVSAPVVDGSGRIVGMITVDDVVDVIEEEAEEDIMHMAGVA
ncbi:MAG: magnesium transporter, partial [Candidatus Nucleicultricaceae bacterium]